MSTEYDYIKELLMSTFVTIKIYMPVWFLGTLIGITFSYIIWNFPEKFQHKIYLTLSGFSFIPVTIFIPFFIRSFGIMNYIYPILIIPVILITFASSFESFQYANKHRSTLLVNYQLKRHAFFWCVIFRESMPSMRTAARQTLSLCFAIFVAIDFFIENWHGLGGLVQKYYLRSSYSNTYYVYMIIGILMTGILGFVQVYINDSIFKKFTEFRRHY